MLKSIFQRVFNLATVLIVLLLTSAITWWEISIEDSLDPVATFTPKFIWQLLEDKSLETDQHAALFNKPDAPDTLNTQEERLRRGDYFSPNFFADYVVPEKYHVAQYIRLQNQNIYYGKNIIVNEIARRVENNNIVSKWPSQKRVIRVMFKGYRGVANQALHEDLFMHLARNITEITGVDFQIVQSVYQHKDFRVWWKTLSHKKTAKNISGSMNLKGLYKEADLIINVQNRSISPYTKGPTVGVDLSVKHKQGYVILDQARNIKHAFCNVSENNNTQTAYKNIQECLHKSMGLFNNKNLVLAPEMGHQILHAIYNKRTKPNMSGSDLTLVK